MVLKHLCQKDGISQYELGEVVRKDRSTISNILRRLEAVGLVTRTPDPNDRRSWLVYVTPKGLSLKGTLEKKLKEINEILTEALTQQEISNLRVYLEKIRTKKSRRQSE
jgi:DNA-binding MarR family transcriptional regulator